MHTGGGLSKLVKAFAFSIVNLDWIAKCRPSNIRSCLQAMGIQRYLFFSIHNCDKHAEVPLMRIKATTEKYLQQSGLNYTVLRLCGFMQVNPVPCKVSSPNILGSLGFLYTGSYQLRCSAGTYWKLRSAYPGGEAGLGHFR